MVDYQINLPAHVVLEPARGVAALASIVGQEDPRKESNDDLAEVPPSRQSDQQPLMALWHKFQEDDAINRDVATSGSTNDRPERAEGDKVLSTSHSAGKDATNQDGGIESWLSADDISSSAPE